MENRNKHTGLGKRALIFHSCGVEPRDNLDHLPIKEVELWFSCEERTPRAPSCQQLPEVGDAGPRPSLDRTLLFSLTSVGNVVRMERTGAIPQAN